MYILISLIVKWDKRSTSSSSRSGALEVWGSGEKGYLFSGSLRALVTVLGELGSKLITLGIWES